MQAHFPKIKLASGISALKKDLPAIVLSNKVNDKKHVSWLHNQWIMGSAVALFMLAIVLISIISSYHNQSISVQALLDSKLPTQ